MGNKRMHNVLLGMAAGFSAGYVAWRCIEAAREIRSASAPCAKDAARYGRLHRGFAVAGIASGLAGATALAYGPSGAALDRMTSPAPVWLRPALFAALAVVGESIVDLPATFAEGYAIERRYGLTPQDAAAWLRDYAKGAALSVGVAAVLATIFGAVVRRAPRSWPLLATIGAFPLLAAASIIVPLYVLPLFNAFEPLTGPLERRLRALAARYGVGDAEILRMDMSKQTSKANAFVIGIGSTHRIVIGDTLLEHFPDDEIEFIVAHELGHYVARDTWRTIFVSTGLAATLFTLANVMVSSLERQQLHDRPVLLARIALWTQVASHALRPALFAFTRSREWAADRFATGATGASRAGASAFRRLRDQNMAENETPRWHEIFFSSHPSLKARIAALESRRPNAEPRPQPDYSVTF